MMTAGSGFTGTYHSSGTRLTTTNRERLHATTTISSQAMDQRVIKMGVRIETHTTRKLSDRAGSIPPARTQITILLSITGRTASAENSAVQESVPEAGMIVGRPPFTIYPHKESADTII